MNEEQRLQVLEEKLDAIGAIITGQGKKSRYNLDALGNKTIARSLGTIRIKDVTLVFPTLTKADQEARLSNGTGLNGTQTMVAIPDTPEVLNGFREAYKNALDYALKQGTLPQNFNAKDPSQNPFIDNIDQWISKISGDTTRFYDELAGKKLLRNAKVRLDGDRPTVLLDSNGEPLSDQDRVLNFSKAEIVITFAAYNNMGKMGIGRYVQGVRITDAGSSTGPSSLFF